MIFKRWITVSATALVVGLVAAGCTSLDEGVADSSTDSASVGTTSEDATSGEVVAALESLEVKGRAPKTGYDRKEFGPAWADTDHNGCDTRNDILARDLEGETFRPGTHDCVVLTGVLDDPFTGTEIHFVRGQDTSTKVQIDHVVALSDAWQKGAQQLDEPTRLAFANDPLNLLAVDGPSNSQKGDGDAATWLPANRSFRCDYVARQIGVKATYGLWVTSAEKDAMVKVLNTCPDQVLPTGQSATTAADGVDMPDAQSPATVAPAPVPAAIPAPVGAGLDPQFSSCQKAKAAGYGPYIAGVDSEYHWYGDGDNDGISCE